MRVTLASASISSLVASAASRTLYDFARSEPGMTRIFGAAMTDARELRGHDTHNFHRVSVFSPSDRPTPALVECSSTPVLMLPHSRGRAAWESERPRYR